MKGVAIVSNAVITPTPVSQATTSFSALGGTPSVSANGTNNGIVWTIQSDAFGSSGPDVLHAYNATNLAQELYNSTPRILPRDNPGGAIIMTYSNRCQQGRSLSARSTRSRFSATASSWQLPPFLQMAGLLVDHSR